MKRRLAKQTQKYGKRAKRAHKKKTGRTGGVHTKLLRSRRCAKSTRTLKDLREVMATTGQGCGEFP